MENGDSENNNNIDKNKNGNISPEPDSHTLFSNGENQGVLNQNQRHYLEATTLSLNQTIDSERTTHTYYDLNGVDRLLLTLMIK